MSQLGLRPWPRRQTERLWQPAIVPILAICLGLALSALPSATAALLLVVLTAVVLIIIEPLAAVTIALLLGPLGALESLRLPQMPISSGQVMFLVVVLTWLGHGAVRREIRLPHTRLTVPLLVFIMVATLSVLTAASLDLALKELVKWVEVLLAMLVVVDLANVRGRQAMVYWLAAILVVATASQAALGIWQFGLAGDGPDHFMILDRYYRAFGTFQQPNPFGGFMSLGASLALGTAVGLAVLLLRSPSRRLADWAWLVFFTAGALIAGMALLFSWSRGAWLGFGAGALALGAMLPRSRRTGLLLVLGAILLALLALRLNVLPSSVLARLSDFGGGFLLEEVQGVDITVANYTVLERLAHWQAAADMAAEEPWLGIGFGNYESAYGRFGLLNWPNPLGHAHNYYLNILAETGVLGALAYLLFWGAVFAQLFGLLRRLDWPYRGLALGLLAAWTGLAVHHLFDKLYVNNLYIYLGVMLGLQQVLDRYDAPIGRNRQ